MQDICRQAGQQMVLRQQGCGKAGCKPTHLQAKIAKVGSRVAPGPQAAWQQQVQVRGNGSAESRQDWQLCQLS